MALKRIKVNNTQYDINDARINGIVDNLTSTDVDKVLSANQGKVLKDLVDTKTSNVGTITGITMNGVSKGTSGVVDLGTVITSHQDISGKANIADLSTVATSGSYNDLTDTPTIDSSLSTTSTNAVQNKIVTATCKIPRECKTIYQYDINDINNVEEDEALLYDSTNNQLYMYFHRANKITLTFKDTITDLDELIPAKGYYYYKFKKTETIKNSSNYSWWQYENIYLISDGEADTGFNIYSVVLKTPIAYTAGDGIKIDDRIISLDSNKGYIADFTLATGATSVTITHDLNTLDVIVQVYNKTTNANVIVDVTRTGLNTVQLDFNETSTDTYRVLITNTTGLSNKNIAANYKNISVSVTPTAVSSYQDWDTNQEYGYSANISITGITENSLILNFVASDSITSAVSSIIDSGTNYITLYTKTNTALSGTIFMISTIEVS